MNRTAVERNARAIIETFERLSRTGQEMELSAGSVLEAKHLLEVCHTFDSLSPEEIDRLQAIPAYQANLRALQDIKLKYNLSWNDLRIMVGMAREVNV